MIRAEHERMASVQLRTLIDNVVNDTSRDMKEQADAVDAAFQRRVVEVDNAKSALEDNLRKVRSLRLFFAAVAGSCHSCTCESKMFIPWGFQENFPQRLRIFNQDFARSLYVCIYAK